VAVRVQTKRRHPQFKKLLSVVRTKRVAVRDYPEDLFVDPALRGKGIGKALITYLAKLATERECGRLEWSVLDWNQPAIDFYHSLGAVMLHDWRINRVTGDTLANMAAMFPASK
jgi:GNAT superfamily N-acetyltransferase